MKQFTPLAYANFKHAIESYKMKCTVEDIEKLYNEPHRYFHTVDHLNRMVERYRDMEEDGLHLHNFEITELMLTILFHDAVYMPWENDNEEKSARLFKSYLNNVFWDMFECGKRVYKRIVASKEHTAHDETQEVFNKLDFDILFDTEYDDFGSWMEFEMQLFKEYQFYDIDKYIEGRIEFLSQDIIVNPLRDSIVNWLKTKTWNVAIYPGSFNPFHIGHLNVLEKAEKLFDKVIILKAVNSDKNKDGIIDPTLIQKLKEQLPNREVVSHVGNIIEKYFVGNKRNPVLIRGLRNGYDLTYEESYLTYCKDIHPDLRYSLILCDKEFSHVSSSAVRSMGVDSNIYKKYVPGCYTKSLSERK